MTLGDLVMVNAFMIQIYIPLNFFGVIYREIKQNLTDLDKMFTLMDRPQEVADAPGAQPLRIAPAAARRCVLKMCTLPMRPNRPILRGVSFEIPCRQDGGCGGPVGRRQVHAGAPAVSLLRHPAGRISLAGRTCRASRRPACARA